MDGDTFFQQIIDLRQQGTSIRAIASQLGVHPGRVQRALTRLSHFEIDDSNQYVFHSDHRGPFVGRDSELALLCGTLDRVISGHGNLVLLTGEPGIGKTRLIEELCSYARSRRVQLYWGRCHEEPQSPPFWPWIQILRTYIQQHKVSRLRSEMGVSAADIATIIPGLLQKLPDIEPAQPLNDPSEDRFRLFDSLSGLFRRSSKKQSMLLIIDNLQWCDELSLQFLRFMSQELADSRLLIVGSYRNVTLDRDHPLTITLGELSRHPYFPQIVLDGLSQDETEQLVHFQTKIDTPEDLVKSVYDRTSGNPLFIIHIARSLKKNDSLATQDTGVDFYRINEIPDSLHIAISQNLAQLSPNCQETIAIAAIIGRQFELSLLQQTLKHIKLDALQDLLDEAVNAGIITQNTERGWYQFTHALVQETLLSGMTADQRTELHARIGMILEKMHGNDLNPQATRLAYHFIQSADLTGPDKAIYYSRLAAEGALAIFAYEEAALQFQRALEVKRKKTPSTRQSIPDDETAELLLGMAKAGAAIAMWSSRQSFESIGPLMDYYLEKKDIASLIEVAKIPTIPSEQGNFAESKRRFAGIFELVHPDSPEAGWLLCIYGFFLGAFAGEYSAGLDAIDRALVIARKHNDLNMEMRAMINSTMIKATFWGCDWEKVQRVIEIAQQLGDRQAETLGWFYTVIYAIATKSYTEAQYYLERAISASTQLRHHTLLGSLNSLGQILENTYGEFQASRDRSKRAYKLSRRDFFNPILRAMTEYELGEPEEGDKFMQQAVENLSNASAGPSAEYGWASAQLPFIHYLTGSERWSDIEDRTINIVLQTAFPDNFLGIMARVGLGLRAITSGDVATAHQSYDFFKDKIDVKLAPHRGTLFSTNMSSDRFLGLLCLTLGDLNKAIVHFQDAIELCRERGLLPELAWSCYDCSRARLLRNKPGDRKKATSMAGEALSVANRLGMKLLAGRINSMAEIQVHKQVYPVNPHNFTSREMEVLELLARGKTNREIAQELVISNHTAATHVKNILNKGNLANRVEAAAFAARYYSQKK